MGQQPLPYLEVQQSQQHLEHQQPLVHPLHLVHLLHSEVHLLQVQPEVLPPEVVFLAANKLNKQVHSEVLQQPLPRVYSEVPHLMLHLLVLSHLMLHLLVLSHLMLHLLVLSHLMLHLSVLLLPMLHLLVQLHNNKVQACLEPPQLHPSINNLLEVVAPYLEV